jgi:DNA-binding transcriptional ArsR family regulator
MVVTGLNDRRRPLAPGDVEPAADLLRSLANPQRLMIVCTLVEGERAVSELERELAIRQPSLSQHLASLREDGIISGRREAKAVFYRISDKRAALIVEALHAIFCEPARKTREQAVAGVSRSARSPRQLETRTAKKSPRVSEAAFFARIGEVEDP